MKQGIKLIVGLGNPGQQYVATRHNLGYLFVQSLAQQLDVELVLDAKFKAFVGQVRHTTSRCLLALPQTFMNLSGFAVSKLLNYYRLSPAEMLVVYDEMDFKVGIAKLKFGGGANGHNGVSHIIEQLGTRDFWRLRLGIGRPHSGVSVTSHVLSQPTSEESLELRSAIDFALTVIPDLLAGEFEAALLKLHSVVT